MLLSRVSTFYKKTQFIQYFSVDFSTMRKKVDLDEYKHIDDLKKDVVLIGDNCMAYNKPNTVYYLAAQKLKMITGYYFSESYLEYVRYMLPFGNQVPHDLLGLKPKAPIRTVASSAKKDPKAENLKAAICDKIDAKTVLKQTSSTLRGRLTEQKLNLAYLDKSKEDGAIALNILTGDEKCSIKLGDFIGKLEKGTPCVTSSNHESCEDLKKPVSYTNYGPFCTFAPQFDSTWASLNKRDSEMLTACYGDTQNTSDALALRQFAIDSNENLVKMVDNLLDTLTDGEHSRTMECLEKEAEDESKVKIRNMFIQFFL
jgi:hypothetical protein